MSPSRRNIVKPLLIISVWIALSSEFDGLKHRRAQTVVGPLQYVCNSRVAVTVDEMDAGCSNNSTETPKLKMAAIIQAFNHEEQAQGVVDSMVVNQPLMERVLVMNDGSTDNSYGAYLQAFRNRNYQSGDVINASNVHEVRNYNRGMKMIMESDDEKDVDIDLFTLMQDDDILAKENPWVERAVDLFQRFPRLCVLGGFRGWAHIENGVLRPPWYPGRHWTHQCGNGDFQFVMGIASSPMILRRQCVQDIGYLSVMYTQPGDPGIFFDIEYSLRAWSSERWQVGIYPTPFRRGVGGHGTLATEEKKLKRREARFGAQRYLQNTYKANGRMHCQYLSVNETGVTAPVDGSNAVQSSW